MSESSLERSKKRTGNYKGRAAGTKNYASVRRFVYLSEAAERVGFDVVAEIHNAVKNNNHEMVKALIGVLKYMAPEISPVDINGVTQEKDDINLNVSISGLITNNEQNSDN